MDERVEAMARAITDTWSSHFGDGKSYDELEGLTKACRYAEGKAALGAYRPYPLSQAEAAVVEWAMAEWKGARDPSAEPEARLRTLKEYNSACARLAEMREGGG